MSDFLASLLLTSLTCASLCQTPDVGKHVYDTSQDSVFLVYLNDSRGKPEALGSAFLVAPKTLVTNAHVVETGAPVLAVGPVRVPVTVMTRDQVNDLAILRVDLDLTSSPLPLASSLATPGERVFAIGNPEGLEKTISEGLVSGIRQISGRTLLQITSPISHGSSGGPILNRDGQVVGVAVGMLTDGQNLNFAVPVSYVRELLSRKATPDPQISTTNLVRISALMSKLNNDKYSSDDDSPYQRDNAALVSATREFTSHNGSPSDLQALTCFGTQQWSILDEGLSSAQKLYEVKHTPENRALLAYILLQKADQDDINAAFAKDGTAEKSRALAAKNSDLKEIEALEAYPNQGAQANRLPLYLYSLAAVKKMREEYASSISLNEAALPHLSSVCGTDLRDGVYRDLISETNNLGRAADAEKWFRALARAYSPTAWDWDSEGDRRDAAGDYVLAADANERAASGNESLRIDYCWAAQENFFAGPAHTDQVLADGRKCVDASVKNTDEQRAKLFDDRLPVVYRSMATVLEDRGVHTAALEYIKQALNAGPGDAQSLYEEAMIFKGMQRYPECISAAQGAISASDGSFKYMHFGLGNCLFEMENWVAAAGSFRIAADDDKSDPAPAFNLALCYERQGFSSDAKVWFEEALKRNPSPSLREQILNAIRGH